MTDTPQPLRLEVGLPSEDQRKLFEEWVKQREEEKQREERENDRVIVIDI